MMKKRVFSLLLAAIMLLGMTPATAFATSGQTVVSYTVSSNYEVNIPASVNLNSDQGLKITASNMNIGAGMIVSVTIDGTKTYENGGNFYLYKDKGTASEVKIRCGLYGMSDVTGLDYEVAKFYDGSTTNSVSESFSFMPDVDGSTAPGTYSGIMYFKISM